MKKNALISETFQWKDLHNHAKDVKKLHLKNLLQDPERTDAFFAEHSGIFFDYARQNATKETLKKLFALADAANLTQKIQAMFAGEVINTTEKRAVLHTALRANSDAVIHYNGQNVVPDVQKVLTQIASFSEKIRNEKHLGATGLPLTNVVAIGIGGSYLGPEFVAEALRTAPKQIKNASGRRLRFLANIDPVDVTRALDELDPENTLVIIISKTFSTAETILNAKTVRAWLCDNIKAPNDEIVRTHMIAISTNIKAATSFGIHSKNIFGFWDWVGGRYSVSSAVGMLPIALQYGMKTVHDFLAGARDIDTHFKTAVFSENLPVLMGLFGIWNSSFLDRPARAILPYTQALHKLSPHVQQVDMESNGKRVSSEGQLLDFQAGEINFGEPGTNGQHSFYQLIHQGRVIPCDFIGFIKSQQERKIEGELVSNHDELMANFFAQPDALAYGKDEATLRKEAVSEELIPHKVFEGNRPSSSLLLSELNAFTIGQLLALYEHRTAVQGFIWGLNSFDQWGVELGKNLAKKVRSQIHKTRTKQASIVDFNKSTTRLLQRYLDPSDR